MTTAKIVTTNDVRGKLVEMLMAEKEPEKAAILSNAIFDSLQKEVSCGFISGKDATTGAEIRSSVGTVAVHFDQSALPAVAPPPNRQMKRSAKHRRK